MSDPLDPDAPKSIMGEVVANVVEVVQRVLNGKRAFHYQALFLDNDGKPNRSAERVLADLARFCRANETTFNADPRVHALLEGRREVFLRISHFLSIDSEDVRQFVEVKDE